MDIILHNKSLQKETDKVDIYNNWASTYEEYVNSIGYKGPNNFSKIFINLVMQNKELENSKIRILDFGCGTGLLGLHIRRMCERKK